MKVHFSAALEEEEFPRGSKQIFILLRQFWARGKKKYNKKRRKNGWKKYTHKTLLGAALSQLCDFSISMLQNCRPGLLWTGLFSWCGPENLAPGQWGQSLQHSSLFLPRFFLLFIYFFIQVWAAADADLSFFFRLKCSVLLNVCRVLSGWQEMKPTERNLSLTIKRAKWTHWWCNAGEKRVNMWGKTERMSEKKKSRKLKWNV